jgi:hypothetical protein
MTDEEARDMLKAYGWTWHLRRRRRGTPYLYAARKRKGHVEERYIGPLSQLSQMTQADIVAKLTR